MLRNVLETLTLIAAAAVQWLFYRKGVPKDWTPKRILVIKLDHVGDVLLATPVFDNLRQAYPNAELHALAGKWSRVILDNQPAVDEVIEYNSPFFCRSGEQPTRLLEAVQLYRRLRRQKYELVVELRGDWRIVCCALLRVAPKQIGRAALQVANKLGFSRFSGTHETTRNLDVLNRAGIPTPVQTPTFLITGEDKKWAADFLAARGVHAAWRGTGPRPTKETQINTARRGTGPRPTKELQINAAQRGTGPRPTKEHAAQRGTGPRSTKEHAAQRGTGPRPTKEQLVAIHPGSPVALKRWRPERYAKLADWLVAQKRAKIIFVGVDAEMPIIAEIQALMREKSFNIAGKTSLTQLASILHVCQLFIGNDSGPMHLAAAVGIPTIGLYGPGDPGRFGPVGVQCQAIRRKPDCPPCLGTTCRFGGEGCMSEIQVADVIQAIDLRDKRLT